MSDAPEPIDMGFLSLPGELQDELSVQAAEARGTVIRAPWNADQVGSLNTYQQAGRDVYTCPIHGDGPGRGVLLYAHEDGWHCQVAGPEACGYRQDWASAEAVNWTWTRLPGRFAEPQDKPRTLAWADELASASLSAMRAKYPEAADAQEAAAIYVRHGILVADDIPLLAAQLAEASAEVKRLRDTLWDTARMAGGNDPEPAPADMSSVRLMDVAVTAVEELRTRLDDALSPGGAVTMHPRNVIVSREDLALFFTPRDGMVRVSHRSPAEDAFDRLAAQARGEGE